jgi:hypothetical protein
MYKTNWNSGLPFGHKVVLRRAVLTCIALTLASTGHAQVPVVYASGLENPTKIIVGPSGTLLVTEAGAAPNSGRVTVIDPGGRRRTLIDGLPSGGATSGPDGPNGLALTGRTLYVATAEGDGFVNGTKAGTLVPNPAGISSPLFATILKVTFGDDIDRLTAGFTLKLQDHFALLDGAQVTLDNGAGARLTMEVLSQFRWAVSDPVTIYRNSHPYGLALLPSQPDSLYVADSGQNTLVQVSLSTGKTRTLARFPNAPSPTPEAIVSEAVPTSVRANGDRLLVTLLSGGPFVNWASRVMDINPTTGAATQFITLLASGIDVFPRIKANGAVQYLVLEYSLALPQRQPGRLLSYDTWEGKTMADNLPSPSAMAYDVATSNLYITSRGNGTVLMINLEK